MRSPQPLLVPLLVFALVGAALIAWHAQIRRSSSRSGFAPAVKRGVVVGLVTLGAGLVLLFAYPLLAGCCYYPLVTPLVVALGGAIAAYCLGTLRFLARKAGASRRPPTGVVRFGPGTACAAGARPLVG
jgi:hypothetical protein